MDDNEPTPNDLAHARAEIAWLKLRNEQMHHRIDVLEQRLRDAKICDCQWRPS